MTWMMNHPDENKLFKYVEKKKLDIILEIILDKEKRDEWKEMEKTNPMKLLQLMMNSNPINIKHEVLEDLKDIDLQKEDVQALKQLKRGNNSRTLSTINSLSEEDKQYLNDHPNALSLFIRNQRENEERMREQLRQMEIMRQDRERRLLELQNLNAQRNIRPRNYHRNRNQNIHNFINNIEPKPFMETLNEEIKPMLQKVFKTVNYNNENNCYYCSLIEGEESPDDYLIIPLIENNNNEIDLNQNIIEITTDFQDTAVILIVPSEDRFNKDNFINDVKVITNIGFDISDLNIVDTIGELISIDNENFSFKGCEKYFLHVKENYINKNLKHFNDWSNSFNT